MVTDEISRLNKIIESLATDSKKHNKPQKDWHPKRYCWSHGYKVKWDHSSKNYKNKCKGHKNKATRDNTFGGSSWNKNWKPKVAWWGRPVGGEFLMLNSFNTIEKNNPSYANPIIYVLLLLLICCIDITCAEWGTCILCQTQRPKFSPHSAKWRKRAHRNNNGPLFG